jgi:hypothetical protein
METDGSVRRKLGEEPAVLGKPDRADQVGHRPGVGGAASRVVAADRRATNVDPAANAGTVGSDRAFTRDVALGANAPVPLPGQTQRPPSTSSTTPVTMLASSDER